MSTNETTPVDMASTLTEIHQLSIAIDTQAEKNVQELTALLSELKDLKPKFHFIQLQFELETVPPYRLTLDKDREWSLHTGVESIHKMENVIDRLNQFPPNVRKALESMHKSLAWIKTHYSEYKTNLEHVE